MARVPFEYPRQLLDFAPLNGLIKEDYEDFFVEELPLYEASGSGTHTYFTLEKRGLSTMQAVRDVAEALAVDPRAIGLAGLKDARAVSRQRLSIEHIEPERLAELRLPRIGIFDITRHTNKLKLGHLAGNRFRVRVRKVQRARQAELEAAWQRLCREGVPNYFGPQRFGSRGDGWAVGRAIARNEIDTALDLMLGRPGPYDSGEILRARSLYDQGQFGEAAQAWPRMFRDERRALTTLARTRGNRMRAFLAVDRRLRDFLVSAYQSYLFNQVIAARISHGLGRLRLGDLAWLHGRGAVFHVDDPAREQPRADAFEISPTGPLFGYRMTEPTGESAAEEQAVLAREGLDVALFRAARLRVSGGRRALRFRPAEPGLDLGADERGPYLEIRFTLEPGCYATSLLRELFVDAPPEEES